MQQQTPANRLGRSMMSFRRFTRTKHQLSHWDFTIYDTYIKLTNIHRISTTSHDPHLPACPPLAQILQSKIPGYMFHSSAWQCRTMWMRFLLFGDEENCLKTPMVFIDSSAESIEIKLQHAAYQMAPAGSLVFYIVPLTFLCIDGLYLRSRVDKHPCVMNTSCSQVGACLDTQTPVVRLQGPMLSWDKENMPFILGQKTKPFLSKFVRVCALADEVCKVHDVCVGDEYVKIHVDYYYALDKHTLVDMCLALTNEAVLSFKFNPFVKTPWKPNPTKAPIVYMGEPVLIPGSCSTKVEYGNKYYVSKGLSATAIIVSLETDDTEFETDVCEWPPESTVQIMVSNKSMFPRMLTPGTHIADAHFLLAERQFLSRILPDKQLKNLSTCLKLPGGFCVNAAKLPSLCKTSASIN
ncbi:orf11 [Alcelaphine gammaherpesvirus 2]|uniref:Orf11 n=1 Tax=Alcelaphine gammaherpesvirus 2 TaxID=138184 RepID=A0A068ABP6_9GAMA|nr:orf11 [Alcelaphine gammaherpesvirus 2]AIA62053.1 orf11 [Alcelaphine gammaherpesvirus 2]